MTLALAILTAWIGGALLALSQARNWRAVTRAAHTPSAVRAARAMGWLLVIVSFALCVLRDGWSFAAILWPFVLALAASLVAMILSFRPQWMKPLVVGLTVVAPSQKANGRGEASH